LHIDHNDLILIIYIDRYEIDRVVIFD